MFSQLLYTLVGGFCLLCIVFVTQENSQSDMAHHTHIHTHLETVAWDPACSINLESIDERDSVGWVIMPWEEIEVFLVEDLECAQAIHVTYTPSGEHYLAFARPHLDEGTVLHESVHAANQYLLNHNQHYVGNIVDHNQNELLATATSEIYMKVLHLLYEHLSENLDYSS